MRIGPLGVWELLIILLVVLLIFGPRRLPEMAKGIGQSVREFRKGIRDMKDDFEAGASQDEKQEANGTRARATSTSASFAESPAKSPTSSPDGAADDTTPVVDGEARKSTPAEVKST